MKFTTDAEYYADTTHLSNSMVSAYLRSPAYYKALYIDKTIDRPITPALEFGSAVDVLLTEGQDAFDARFSRKVLKRDDPDLFEENKSSGKTILSPQMWIKVHQVVDKVSSTEAFKWLTSHNAMTQVTLTGEIEGIKVKGKLDFLTIVKDVAFIDDLKTTKNVKPIKHLYHCHDYNYFNQAWMYKQLVLQNYPEVSMVYNRHLVVSKEDWPRVSTFILSEMQVDRCEPIVRAALHGITNKEFSEKEVSWSNAHTIGVTEEEEVEWNKV